MTAGGAYDVLVAGGGSAGLAAAVAAARSGARTLLIERHGSLGGMTTAALVHSICGLYHLRDEAETPEAVMAHGGFPAEVARRLLESGGATGPVRIGRVDLLLHSPPAFALLADALTAAEPLLSLRLHTELIAADAGNGRVQSVETVTRGQRERHHAAAFIDTTGDAQLATFAGAACEQADCLQRPAFIFALGGVETGSLDADGRLRIARSLVAAVREERLPRGVLGAHFRASGRPGEVYATLDLDDPPGLRYDPHSPRCLAELEQYGRRLASLLLQELAGSFPAFRHAYIAAFPARIGVRESRRIVGEVTLEAADLLEGRTFPDTVALSAWPLEMREQPTGPRLRFPTGNRAGEIPLRALKAKGWSNLLAAGRCLSASHEALAALRVIGTCMATGEAAGKAAAEIAKNIGSEPEAKHNSGAHEYR